MFFFFFFAALLFSQGKLQVKLVFGCFQFGLLCESCGQSSESASSFHLSRRYATEKTR